MFRFDEFQNDIVHVQHRITISANMMGCLVTWVSIRRRSEVKTTVIHVRFEQEGWESALELGTWTKQNRRNCEEQAYGQKKK